MRFGLRAQLLIVSGLLLALPWLGLRAAREIEAFLVETQEQGLASTARAVATALNERPGVFLTDTIRASAAGPGGAAANPLAAELRIETRSSPIGVDAVADDWAGPGGGMRELPPLTLPLTASSPAPTPAAPALRARYRLGRYERNIYALIDVTDDVVVRYASEFPKVGAADHVEIATVTADDEFLRFAISEAGDGSARVTLVDPQGLSTPDARIEAALVETNEGYRVEVRIPRTLVGSRLALAVTDVDDHETHAIVSRVGTSPTDLRDGLSSVFMPSPELAALAQGLGRARSRLWVLDTQGRVLAQAGTLQRSPALLQPPTWRQQLVMTLRPVYGSILAEPVENFTDRGTDARQLEGAEITQALRGARARWRRRTSDGRAAVLSAAEPVWSEGRVVGAVLAEETTNETLAARNRAFERLFFSIAGVVLLGALTLLAFATRLSFRIRGLRNAVERAIDGQGRGRSEIPTSAAQDEVGDLSRSFASLLERQEQYTAYLEGLRSRLSHEIRTPVAVVRSSLDNLRLHQVPEAATVYLDRADEGLSRLVTIMQRITEASRLEQTLATNERERFDLTRVVAGCVEGYRLAHPMRGIDLALETGAAPLTVVGAPDLVAQLLDKLVDNALDFASPGTPVKVRLTRGLGIGFLAVSNEGVELPEAKVGRLFESMVSARPTDSSGKVHLGLGLTIVKAIADFHDATVSASNRKDAGGVVFSVAFPLATRPVER